MPSASARAMSSTKRSCKSRPGRSSTRFWKITFAGVSNSWMNTANCCRASVSRRWSRPLCAKPSPPQPGGNRFPYQRGRWKFGETPVEAADKLWQCVQLSPTIFRYRNYRFYFFSREEPRMHVHVISPDGEAKFWLEPDIELAVNQGLGSTELNELKKVVEERQNEIREHWHRHFQS